MRTPSAGWKVAGAALLSAWTLAACDLEPEHAAASAAEIPQNRPAAGALNQVSRSDASRRAVATIQTGEIALIERYVVSPSSRGKEEVLAYRVVVRLEDGQTHEFIEPSLGDLKLGDRVQVVRNGTQPTS